MTMSTLAMCSAITCGAGLLTHPLPMHVAFAGLDRRNSARVAAEVQNLMTVVTSSSVCIFQTWEAPSRQPGFTKPTIQHAPAASSGTNTMGLSKCGKHVVVACPTLILYEVFVRWIVQCSFWGEGQYTCFPLLQLYIYTTVILSFTTRYIHHSRYSLIVAFITLVKSSCCRLLCFS